MFFGQKRLENAKTYYVRKKFKNLFWNLLRQLESFQNRYNFTNTVNTAF